VNTVAKRTGPKLVWWNVSLIGGKRATPFGLMQAPQGDADTAGGAAGVVTIYHEPVMVLPRWDHLHYPSSDLYSSSSGRH